jgi:hypothetical protein
MKNSHQYEKSYMLQIYVMLKSSNVSRKLYSMKEQINRHCDVFTSQKKDYRTSKLNRESISDTLRVQKMSCSFLHPLFVYLKGAINMRKLTYVYKWSVNKYRRDKRTGAIDPEPRSAYLKMLFKEEEDRFRKTDKK